MRIRIVASLLTVVVLCATFSLSKPARATPTVIRFISDANELGPGNVIGQTFKVAMVVEDVANLYGLDITVKWNIDYFRVQSCLVTIPVEKYPVPIPPSPYPGILHGDMISPPPSLVMNDTTARIGYTSMTPLAFNGNGTVAVFTFKVTDQLLYPQNSSFMISFVSSVLADNVGNPIPHVTNNLEIPLYGIKPFNIKVTNVKPYARLIVYGSRVRINVTVVNEGDYPETFNLTLYANTSGGTATFVMMANSSATITYEVWGFIPGNYTLWAYVWPVKGETNETDNTFVDGMISVIVIGDVDGDGDVDILDMVRITSKYGSKRGEPLYDPRCDLDGDGAITILDVVTCTAHYGEKYPYPPFF